MKGVICKILEDHEMPVDELGNRADLIVDGAAATISRMNIGRTYEAYLGAFARDNRTRIINNLVNKYGVNYINKLKRDDILEIKDYLRNMYSFFGPRMLTFIDNLNMEEVEEHVLECLEEWIYLYLPPDNERIVVDIIRDIDASPYKPHMGKLTYIDSFGRTVTTNDDAQIGRAYYLELDRTGRDYSGVSSAKVNSFVLPIKGGENDKHKYPHSLTPITNLSETEVRIITSLADPVMIAELIDLALNPNTHRQLVRHMLTSEKMYDKDLVIDREVNPYGNNKSLLLMKHIFRASGVEISYNAENPSANVDEFNEERDHALVNTLVKGPQLDSSMLFSSNKVVAYSEKILPERVLDGIPELYARDVLLMTREQVWNLAEGKYHLYFEDGVEQLVTKDDVVINRYVWELFTLYPDTPMVSRCSVVSIIGDGYLNSKTHVKLLEVTYQHLCKENNLRFYYQKEFLGRKVVEVFNMIFNEIIHNVSPYVLSINAMDFINIVDEPAIKEIHASVENTPESVERAYRGISKWVRETDSKNPLVWAYRTGSVNPSQLNQCIGPRGFVTDLDRTVFTTPIKTGFIVGMNTMYDLMTESRTAAKALNAAGNSIRKSEYASRRFQLLGMSVERVTTVDCNSTDYLEVVMSKEYLPNFKGKWYVEEGGNELKCIVGNETDLIGKLLYVRTAFGCQVQNRHHICTTCLGAISENFKENSNLGYTMAADFMQRITQRILSFKHEVKSVSGSDMELEGEAVLYFSVNAMNEVFMLNKPEFRNKKLILDGNKFDKLIHALNTADLNTPLAKVGEIDFIQINSMDDSEKVLTYVSKGDSTATITRHLLHYIKQVEYSIDQKGNYIVPLADWDFSKPMFEIPLKEADLVVFVQKIEELIEGTQKDKNMTFKEHFFRLVDIVFTHAPCNISVLEVLAYAASTYNPDEGNYRQSRGAPIIHYGNRTDLFNNRSMSQLLVYEKQMSSLLKKAPTIFGRNVPRQRHPTDVLIMPDQVVKNRSVYYKK